MKIIVIIKSEQNVQNGHIINSNMMGVHILSFSRHFLLE